MSVTHKALLWTGAAAAAAFLASGLGAAVLTQHVHIQGFAFGPNNFTIDRTGTVMWDNHDAATHTATDNKCPRAGGAGPCDFDSLNMGTGAVFSRALGIAGDYVYRCTIHGFTGRLTVADPNAKADYVVDNLQIVDLAPNGWTQKRADVTIRNVGNRHPTETTTVQAGYFYQGQWVTIGQANVAAIPAGTTRSASINWDVTFLLGDFTVRAVADNQNQLAELNEANNIATKTTSVKLPPGTLPGLDVRDPI